MAKHLLFFIHGMGKHDDTWHEPGLKVLKASFDEYPLLKKHFEFDDTFEPVPVVYDNEFEDLRKRWGQDVADVKAALLGDLDGVDETRKQLVQNKMDDISEWTGAGGDTFFATHAMDVILYRFFKTVRMNVNIQVANQIGQMIKGADGVLPSWSVLAHSLGTAVCHNTLHSMYSTEFPNGITLRTEDTRPRVVMMVSNLSRVLQLPSLPVLDEISHVRPGSALSGRCCMYYLNVRHRLDPFTIPKPFAPDTWPEAETYNSKQYQHIVPSHFLIKRLEEVHDFDHYLRNPRVHVPFFRAVLGEDFVPESDFLQAKRRFDAEVIDSSTDVIREKLEKLQQSLGSDWRALIAILKKWRS